MQHFPIFMALAGRRVVVSGGGEAAVAKLRLLLKTQAHITVIAPEICEQIQAWARNGRLTTLRRAMEPGDAMCAALFYAANDDDVLDAQAAALAHRDGALVNWVDNLENSQFITPAIVDRDPVTVAIGTEGAAPVLARAIKADLEERLPSALGPLARIGKAFRTAANALPFGRARRDFWRDYYFNAGPKAIADGEAQVRPALDDLLADHLNRKARETHVAFVGAGPGDPDLLTLKARKLLDEADVILHDRLVPAPILELARREAIVIETGKTGFGPAMAQEDITQAILDHAQDGAQVVRLKSGDAAVFGRLEEELQAVEAAGIAFSVIPGITAASAAISAMGQSFTARGRNSGLRIVTGHDVKGFADQDWAALAQPGQVTAIYMGLKAARFVQGRLLMVGASADTPVTLAENVGRPNQRLIPATLATLADVAAHHQGPAVLILGLHPRQAATLPLAQEAFA